MDDAITMDDKMIKTEGAMVSGSDGLAGEIEIGSLLPLTGDLSSKGDENLAGQQLGVDDFNEYLKGGNAAWQLKLISEDSETQPVKALEKPQSLKAKGADVLVPETGNNVRHIKVHSDSDILFFSCCSTAPGLAIPNDSIYGMVPTDDIRGHAPAKVIRDGGHEVLITVESGDAWGDGPSNATVISFKANGSTVAEEFRHNQDSPEFSATVSPLAAEVTKQTAAHGADKVAVSLIAFDEAKLITRSASRHDVFDAVSWSGSDANAGAQAFVDDPAAPTFMANVNFTGLRVLTEENPGFNSVKTRISEKPGRAPNAYGSAGVIGKTIEPAGSADVDDVKSMLVDVANAGVGQTKINEAGDSADYDIWAIRNGTWAIVGTHSEQ